MKNTFIIITFALFQAASVAATIDLMTLNPYGGGTYSPTDPQIQMVSPASVYYLSDGTSWQSGAGVFYTPSTTFETAVVSDGYVYYHFAPLDNGVLFQQTDYDGGNHSAQGTLGWAGDVVLVAQIGSTEAMFSGYTTILDNIEAQYASPGEFNYYSASVGQSVYFQMDFTIYNPAGASWQPDTFATPFSYAATGYVDFTQVVPEPSVSVLCAVGAVLMCTFRKMRSNTALEPTPTAP